MSKGKIAAQVAHASIGSYKRADKQLRKIWEREGAKKVVLKVKDEMELIDLQKKVFEKNLPNFLVIDAGLTQLPSATITCLGIGPDEDKKIDELIKDLKLL